MNRPTPIILDTDMGNDIDDALALAMLHALQSRGMCRLLAVMLSKDNPYAAPCVDAFNTFYRRGNIPIGQVAHGAMPQPVKGDFIRHIVEMKRADGTPTFPRTHPENTPYPESVSLLRKLLAEAEPLSVVPVLIGFSTNFARLLQSGPCPYSPLDGHALFARAIKQVVIMAANFSEAVQSNLTLKNREYNIVCDIESARYFIENCPRPMFFSGWEIGNSLPYPATALDEDFQWCHCHPIVEAYRQFLPMPYDRACWDLTAVLFAVCQNLGYFELSQPGRVCVSADGIARFTPDEMGTHRHLILDPCQHGRINEAHRQLVSQPIG